MKYVKVQFEKPSPAYTSSYKGGVFTYFVPEGDEPEVGDYVLTSISSDTSFEAGYPLNFKMARVLNVLTEDDGKATKFYKVLISAKALKERVVKNKEYLAKIEERKIIKQQLDEMLQKQSDVERYQRLRSDPVASALIDKLQELG